MDWFLYDNGFRHERVKLLLKKKISKAFPNNDVKWHYLSDLLADFSANVLKTTLTLAKLLYRKAVKF